MVPICFVEHDGLRRWSASGSGESHDVRALPQRFSASLRVPLRIPMEPGCFYRGRLGFRDGEPGD